MKNLSLRRIRFPRPRGEPNTTRDFDKSRMDLRETFAKRFGEVRRMKKLSMRAAGARFDPPVSGPYICALESGKKNPTLAQVEKAAKALGVSPEKLLR